MEQVAEQTHVPLKNFEVDRQALDREFEGWDSEETKTFITPEQKTAATVTAGADAETLRTEQQSLR